MGIKGTLIGAGLGWALGGPIGALLGGVLGARFDEKGSPFQMTTGKQQNRAGDMMASLLVLFGHVTRADGKVMSSEVNYVKQFLVQNFGIGYARDMMKMYKDIVNRDYPIVPVCRQIRRNMPYHDRLELLHLLYGLARADGDLAQAELNAINEVADGLGINPQDHRSIRAMFRGNGSGRTRSNQTVRPDYRNSYEILGVDANASNSEVKAAYRKLANKYHPDKVQHLGEEFSSLAEEKFKAINEAYQNIRDQRSL